MPEYGVREQLVFIKLNTQHMFTAGRKMCRRQGTQDGDMLSYADFSQSVLLLQDLSF